MQVFPESVTRKKKKEGNQGLGQQKQIGQLPERKGHGNQEQREILGCGLPKKKTGTNKSHTTHWS